MTKILIIEDDPQIIATMTVTLQKWQYQVATVQDWQHVAQRVDETVALVLCDITLPSFDGFYWIQTIRQTSAVPIIVISAAAIDDNVMHAVAAGADDYLMKPFSMTVLVAKIQALLRRRQQASPQYRLGVATLNPLTNELCQGTQVVKLSPTQAALLKLLLAKPNQTVTKQELLELLWQGGEYLDENTLNVNISRLRRKLAQLDLATALRTERGLGYRVVTDDA